MSVCAWKEGGGGTSGSNGRVSRACAAGGHTRVAWSSFKMDSGPTPVPGTTYRPAPLASLPETLDMRYYQWTPEKKLLEAKRLAIRARLKREYLLKLNDPSRISMIQDPAVVRWNNARIYGPTQHSSAKPKASLLGIIFALCPFALSYYAVMTSREHQEKRMREGKYDRPYHYLY